MPNEQVKQDIQSAYNTLAERISGFIIRRAQMEMIATVANTIAPNEQRQKRISVIEGQTGTGKSIGYMVGAIPVAQQQNLSLVISTATVALQEQLIEKDLPLIQQKAGMDFEYRIAKGRRRYMCPRNLSQLTGANEQQESIDFGVEHEGGATWSRPPKAGEQQLVTTLEKKFDSKEWSGDFDELAQTLDPELQDMISTTNAGCSGSNCPFSGNCPFFESRKGLKEADVVIANHDLVLSDLSLGGGVVLPEPDSTAYIFDEAHHLPDKAIAHFAHHANLKGSVKAMESVRKTAGRVCGLISSSRAREHQAKIDTCAKMVSERTKALSQQIAGDFPEPSRFERNSKEDQVWRFEHGRTPELYVEAGIEIARQHSKVANSAETIKDELKEALKKGEVSNSAASKLLQEIGHDCERCASLTQAWQNWAKREDSEAIPMARWCSKNGDDVSIAASAISASAMLREMVWKKAHSCVLTSATLTALNSFQRFQRAAGLRANDGTTFLRLASPFNYQQAGSVEVPRLNADPSNPEAHTKEVYTYLNHCVDASAGTLVLFASARQMNEVYENLSDDLRQRCLRQNAMTKGEILQEHERAIQSGKGSIIFGLASFSEGVDLPGKLCTHVVIAKLPFAVPNTPVEASRAEWLESRGYNPFMEITVPDASLKLIQAVGRLIRSEEDHGTVTILDTRMLTKRYGKQLLESIPPLAQNIGNPPWHYQVNKSA